MKIDNNISDLAAGLGGAQSSQASRTNQTGATNDAARANASQADLNDFGGGDHVVISDFATQALHQLTAQAGSSDPGNIERLRAAYNSGTYNVPASQIAASVMSYSFAD